MLIFILIEIKIQGALLGAMVKLLRLPSMRMQTSERSGVYIFKSSQHVELLWEDTVV